MSNASAFVPPALALKGAIERAYSIQVMYREPIRAPHATPGMPDNGTPDSRLRAIMAKLDVHQVHLPFQMGRQKRDLRILMSYALIHRENRDYFRTCKGHVDNSRQHASLRAHREGC